MAGRWWRQAMAGRNRANDGQSDAELLVDICSTGKEEERSAILVVVRVLYVICCMWYVVCCVWYVVRSCGKYVLSSKPKPIMSISWICKSRKTAGWVGGVCACAPLKA